MSWQVGDEVRCSVAFVDSSGQPADPTTVQFKRRTSGKAETTLVYGTDVEVVRDSVGAFHVDVYLTEGGKTPWWFRWVATGAVRAATETSLKVDQTEFADPL